MVNQHPDNKEEILSRIERLLLVVAKAAIAPRLEVELQERRMKILYENTGQLSVTALSKKTGYSAGKISGIWKAWERQGILVKDGRQYKRIL